MSNSTEKIGVYSFACPAGGTIDLTRPWIATFQKGQHEGKPLTVASLVRPALVRRIASKRNGANLIEVGVYLWTNGDHLDGRIFDVEGMLSYRSASAAPTSAPENYAFSFQFLGDRVSLGMIAVTMIEVDLPSTARAMDVVVDMTLSQLMVPEKPALEPVIVPASLGFLPYLHDPDVCDCSFLASRLMLMRASPYFIAIFSGDWAEAETARTEPIQFTAWSAPAVALAFIHISSGWTPDVAFPTHTPTDLVADFACDPAMLSFATWRHLLDLAQYLGLKEFAMAVNRKLIALREEQSRELAAMPDVLPDENPRPHKRARVNGDAPPWRFRRTLALFSCRISPSPSAWVCPP